MRRSCVLAVFFLMVGVKFIPGLDGSTVRADFTFGQAVNLRSVIPVIDPAYESPESFSCDGLEIYLSSNRPGGFGGMDVWVLRRTSPEGQWNPPVNLGPAVNTASSDAGACISADGLRLYFNSNRPEGYGSFDLYKATRATRNDPWSQAVNLGPRINTAAYDYAPCESPDGLELYFTSTRPGGYGQQDGYVTRRATLKDPWGDPVNLGPLVNTAYDDAVGIWPDALALLIVTTRPGGYGDADFWLSRRATISDLWQAPVNLGPTINTGEFKGGGHISPDGRALCWWDGDWENWQTPITPVFDFNADGELDLVDLVALIENWGTDGMLYDIGPMPWGDGIVDIEDLKVLIAEWEKAHCVDSQDGQ